MSPVIIINFSAAILFFTFYDFYHKMRTPGTPGETVCLV
jgi:hypothetical protein